MACVMCGISFNLEQNGRILPCNHISCDNCLKIILRNNLITCRVCNQTRQIELPVREFQETDDEYFDKVKNMFGRPQVISKPLEKSSSIGQNRIDKMLNEYRLLQICEDHGEEMILYSVKPISLGCITCAEEWGTGIEIRPIPQMVNYLNDTLANTLQIHEQKLAIFEQMSQYATKHSANQSLKDLVDHFDSILSTIQQENRNLEMNYQYIQDKVLSNNRIIKQCLDNDISNQKDTLELIQGLEALKDDDIDFLKFFDSEKELSVLIKPLQKDYKSSMRKVNGFSRDLTSEIDTFIDAHTNIVRTCDTGFVVVPSFSK